MAKTPTQIYQIKVTLNGSRPPIWRRIQVAGNTTLLKLHDILQSVMGWEDGHLHMFTIEDSSYAPSDYEEYGDMDDLDEEKFKLSQVILREGQRFTYEYDFGDSWRHTLLVEKILPPEKSVHYPICLAGKRACPPEDIGGIGGYYFFLEVLNDPEDENHEQMLEWYGGEFDPEAFDLEQTNAILRQIGRGRSTKELDSWKEDEAEPQDDLIDTAVAWVRTLPEDLAAVADNLPLRRDIVALLSYLRDNKVVGTPSTGNFPVKAVHEICDRFVDPTVISEATGDGVYRIRSEFDVPPLYFRHVLAAVAGLIEGGLGRRWKLTSKGENFLSNPASLQVWLLFLTWWTQVNWLITILWGLEEDYLPDRFRTQALKQLLDLPVEKPVAFDAFADRLVKAGGLQFDGDQPDRTRMVQMMIVENGVIVPLTGFGILTTTDRPHKTLGEDYRQLDTIQLTRFGKALLETTQKVIKQM